MSSLVIEGVYVPVATPFTASQEINFDALTKVIEHCIGAGVAGIVSCGTTGEYYAMSVDERLAIMEHTAKITKGRAQLVAGCNIGATRDTIMLAQKSKAMGYDAIMLAAPPTSLPSQKELAAHFIAVADGGGLPIILYNYPARAGVEIGYECLDLIAKHPGIVGIKESSSDFSRFLYLKRTYGEDITIMCGSDDQAADYFYWGVRSWLAGTANVLPAEHVDIVKTANAGDLNGARDKFARILPWVQAMESGAYNQKVKIGLGHFGIDCGPVRQPLLPLSDADTKAILDVLKSVTA